MAALGAGDVARGGARAARVTAEPDTGRARWRRDCHQIRAGVGEAGRPGGAGNGLGPKLTELGGPARDSSPVQPPLCSVAGTRA